MIEIAAWVAYVAIVVSYWFAARQPDRVRWLHVANFFGAWPIGYLSLRAGLWSNFAITATFGLIGGYGMLRCM